MAELYTYDTDGAGGLTMYAPNGEDRYVQGEEAQELEAELDKIQEVWLSSEIEKKNAKATGRNYSGLASLFDSIEEVQSNYISNYFG